jgi:hypothetical protein
MLFLARSTAININIGPFLSSGDGTTVLDALTIASTSMWVSKNLAAAANISGAPVAVTQGLYALSLGASDTNTAGPLQLWVKTAGALYVWHEYMVLPGAIYNALISGSAFLPTNVNVFSAGVITTAAFAASALDSTVFAGGFLTDTKVMSSTFPTLSMIDATMTSRASATLWTATVASRINVSITAAVSAPSLALIAANLDHLMLTPVNDVTKLGDGGGNEVPDSTVLSLLLSKGLDTDTYSYITDSQEAARDYMVAAAASLALTAFAGPTLAQVNALAASLALSAYGPFANLDALISTRATSTVWTSVVAGRIDANISSVGGTSDTSIALAVWANATRTLTATDGVEKNTALAGFEFLMVDATDGITAETGLAITATRSIDGGAFGACANAAAEVGFGIYQINLAATDLNGDVITLRFAATGALDRFVTIKTNT